MIASWAPALLADTGPAGWWHPTKPHDAGPLRHASKDRLNSGKNAVAVAFLLCSFAVGVCLLANAVSCCAFIRNTSTNLRGKAGQRKLAGPGWRIQGEEDDGNDDGADDEDDDVDER